MRLLFLGTPDLAVPSLEAVVHAGHDVCRVIAQPDRARDRGQRVLPTPVHAAAARLGLPVDQPTTVKDPTLVREWSALAPDAFIVVAYGRIIPDPLLALAPHRWINMHPSLLPLYRGPAPIQGPLLNGDRRTGVTTIALVSEMDAGPILLQRETDIAPDETAGDLHDRLARLGADCLVDTLAALDAGTLAPRPQDHARATFTKKLTKADGVLDFREDATALRNRVRAMTPWPGATATLEGAPLRLLAVETTADAVAAPPGTVLRADDAGILVATGAGALCIRELQRPGKKPLAAAAFLRGSRITAGARFDVPNHA